MQAHECLKIIKFVADIQKSWLVSPKIKNKKVWSVRPIFPCSRQGLGAVWGRCLFPWGANPWLSQRCRSACSGLTSFSLLGFLLPAPLSQAAGAKGPPDPPLLSDSPRWSCSVSQSLPSPTWHQLTGRSYGPITPALTLFTLQQHSFVFPWSFFLDLLERVVRILGQRIGEVDGFGYRWASGHVSLEVCCLFLRVGPQDWNTVIRW